MPHLTTSEVISILKIKPKILEEMKNTLSNEEYHVLRERYGIKEGPTWEEIGQGMGKTGERARQIAKKALRKMHYAPLRGILVREGDLKISIRN